ncbi:MAG: cytochrome c3 family protein [Gammaproteobacteria bacterium]|nr:cytochrome c3 family protein [Gammaproteobacteria bacterium]
MYYTFIQLVFWVLLAGFIGSAVQAEEPGKFEGEFWNKGTHFQLTGKAIPIAEDGIHDPTNITAMYGLQPPDEALAEFPRDDAGLTNWVQALRSGMIAPRSDLMGTGPELKPFDLDLLFTNTQAMPNVLFSHKVHTEWLACKNCHPAVFEQKKGAAKIQMADILNGKYCGLCHGKIAFSPTLNCMRCHSVEPKAKK